MKKHITSILAGAACLLCLFCAMRIVMLENQVSNLIGLITDYDSMVRSQLNAFSSGVHEALDEQASIIADSGYQFGAADMESLTVPVTVTVSPKEYIPGVTSAALYMDGREYPMEHSRGSFSATVNLMLVEDVEVEAVTFEEAGVVRTEKLGWNLSPRGMYLPEVSAQFSGSGTERDGGEGMYSYSMQGDILVDAYGGIPPLDIRSISLVEALDGEFTNRTLLDHESCLVHSDSDGSYMSYVLPIEEQFTFPFGSTHTLYLEAEDQHGFVHRCAVARWIVDENGSGGPDKDEWQWNGATGNLYSGDGKLIYQNYPEP